MTPPQARWARGRQMVRCWIGLHELAADVPVTEDGTRQPVLRQRCLHCGHVSAGWEIGEDGPRYTRTYDADRLQLVLHNGRLRRCECRECQEKRAARGPGVVRMKQAG